jgi:hypothetical protein
MVFGIEETETSQRIVLFGKILFQEELLKQRNFWIYVVISLGPFQNNF